MTRALRTIECVSYRLIGWCFGIAACLAGAACGSAEHPVQPDAGDEPMPWDCTGSHGRKLSCDSPSARGLFGAKYDAERRCFRPKEALNEECAVPTFCPGGGGELSCVVDPAGHAFGIYLFYGEELSNADWHHSTGQGLPPPTLTTAEEALCAALLANRRAVIDSMTGAQADERALNDPASPAQLSPQCD